MAPSLLALLAQVNGRLACLGTSQHLKAQYGQGYLMEIKTRNPDKEVDVHEFVTSLSTSATLDESHSGQMKYTLPEVRLFPAFPLALFPSPLTPPPPCAGTETVGRVPSRRTPEEGFGD